MKVNCSSCGTETGNVKKCPVCGRENKKYQLIETQIKAHSIFHEVICQHMISAR